MAVLGLNTVHDDIPYSVMCLFWSIASVLYIHRPMHAPTVLGIRNTVKDCRPGAKLQTPKARGHAPSKFLMAMKAAGLKYLKVLSPWPFPFPLPIATATAVLQSSFFWLRTAS